MKKLLLSSLMFSGIMLAQEKESYCSISFGTDVKNAVMGSKPTNNKPAADLILNINMVGNDFELSVGDENFSQIGFNRFSVDFGYHSQRYIPLGNYDFDFTMVPSVGFSTISRWGGVDHEDSHGNWIYGKSNHIAVQGNLSFRYKLSDRFLIDWTANLMTRPDLMYLYPTDNPKFIVLSNFIKLHYILN